jgi:hypothetical protein
MAAIRCKFFETCIREDCTNEHDATHNFGDALKKHIAKCNKKECNAGNDCMYKETCYYKHPPQLSMKRCKFQYNCMTVGCTEGTHPYNWNDDVAHENLIAWKNKQVCKYGVSRCINNDCQFSHPPKDGWCDMRTGCDDETCILKHSNDHNPNNMCFYKGRCVNIDCVDIHPKGWNPAQVMRELLEIKCKHGDQCKKKHYGCLFKH